MKKYWLRLDSQMRHRSEQQANDDHQREAEDEQVGMCLAQRCPGLAQVEPAENR